MNEWEWNLLEDKAAVDQLEIIGTSVKVGSRVRLHPKEGGDILDIALRGQVATIESIEEDYEGVRHVCVVLEDDPGRDLGMMRQPGHRFFFTPAELEPLLDSPHTPSESATISKRGQAGYPYRRHRQHLPRRRRIWRRSRPPLDAARPPPVRPCYRLRSSRPRPCLCLAGRLQNHHPH